MFLTRTVSSKASYFLLSMAIVFFFVIVFYAQLSLRKIGTTLHAETAAPPCGVVSDC
jgi:hypothetical protein